MQQLDLPDMDYPTPVLNDNYRSVNWTDSGCKPTKKSRHKNLAELEISEAKPYGEVFSILWMPGATNPADIFTKEDNNIAHYGELRDLMVTSREFLMESQEHRWEDAEINNSLYDLENKDPKLFNISDEIIDLGSLTQWTTKDTKMNANYPVTQIEVPVDGYGPPPIPFLSFV